jgi:putative flippase GtrA
VAVDDVAPARSGSRGVLVCLAIVVCAYAAVASATTANTLPALIAVMLPAAAVTAWTFRAPPITPDTSPRLRRAAVLWACVIAAGVLWEVGALFGEHTVGQSQYPTLSALAEPALQNPVVRFAAWIGWLLAGWRLVRR